jgi:hypothetical protein
MTDLTEAKPPPRTPADKPLGDNDPYKHRSQTETNPCKDVGQKPGFVPFSRM